MKEQRADLFLFMGQSNMAGRGETCAAWPEGAPALLEGAGWEFRAVSDPTRLYPIGEPFGVNENRPDGICEAVRKSGSMVTAFVNAYYEGTGVPVIGVSASKGGSRIREWQPGTPMLTDAANRLAAVKTFLAETGIPIRHIFMLWCQGESDGDAGVTPEQYQAEFENMLDFMEERGVERCFLVQIGCYNGPGAVDYGPIRQAQEVLAGTDPRVIMVSRSFASMKERGLMKDSFHYYQAAYNEVGTEAGKAAAEYVRK